MKNENNWIQWFFVAVAILFVIITIQSASAVNIYGGDDFWCNQSNSTIFCIEDNSTCPEINYTCDVEQWGYNISLYEGETYLIDTEQCVVGFECIGDDVNDTGTCKINKKINPDESYTKDNGACEVDVECRACELDEYDGIFTSYNENIEIVSEDDIIYVRFMDEEYPFHKNGNFTYSFDLDYKCPLDLDLNKTIQSDTLLELCREANPYLLEWTDLAMKRQIDISKSFEGCNNEKINDKDEYITKNAELQTKVTDLDARLVASINSHAECDEDRKRIQGNSATATAFIVLLSLICGASTFLCIVLGLLLYHEKQKGGSL